MHEAPTKTEEEGTAVEALQAEQREEEDAMHTWLSQPVQWP